MIWKWCGRSPSEDFVSLFAKKLTKATENLGQVSWGQDLNLDFQNTKQECYPPNIDLPWNPSIISTVESVSPELLAQETNQNEKFPMNRAGTRKRLMVCATLTSRHWVEQQNTGPEIQSTYRKKRSQCRMFSISLQTKSENKLLRCEQCNVKPLRSRLSVDPLHGNVVLRVFRLT
jgi:hypothetical protein